MPAPHRQSHPGSSAPTTPGERFGIAELGP